MKDARFNEVVFMMQREIAAVLVIVISYWFGMFLLTRFWLRRVFEFLLIVLIWYMVVKMKGVIQLKRKLMGSRKQFVHMAQNLNQIDR
jgi:hypothetical protein